MDFIGIRLGKEARLAFGFLGLNLGFGKGGFGRKGVFPKEGRKERPFLGNFLFKERNWEKAPWFGKGPKKVGWNFWLGPYQGKANFLKGRKARGIYKGGRKRNLEGFFWGGKKGKGVKATNLFGL